MSESALKWLYTQLKKKRIALGNAESKPNTPKEEVDNIKSAIDVIEWIIEKVLNSKDV